MNNTVPKHIAFIMDGNRRWARERGLTTKQGHEAGFQKLIEMIEICASRGVEIVTIYALSTENIKKRSKTEIATLFGLITREFVRSRKRLQEHGVQLSFYGKIKQLPKDVQDVCIESMKELKDQSRIKCNIMLNYGGRDEIVQAVQSIVAAGIDIKEINEELISEHLYTRGLPDPDLIVRTGGDIRLSNFLIWQMSYSELAFTSTLWPDISETELDTIFDDYARRSRRFGGNDQDVAFARSTT
jgi:undecaprenyl diphosphate synthase